MTPTLQHTEHYVLASLAYFDMFDYPLTAEEIHIFLGRRNTSPFEIERALQTLLEEALVFRMGEFYSLQNKPLLEKRRLAGNKRAAAQLQTARRIAAFLSRFPYVRGIAVSGSLSKNFADDTSDIDFFIITAPNRLWIARTLMHFFKKFTFLVHRQHWFCMNYYIDETNLQIPEKNIFTATEVVTVLPFQGAASFKTFFAANNHWVAPLLPNAIPDLSAARELRKGFFKSAVESLFNNRMGEKIDNWLMRLTDKRWQQKTTEGHLNQRGIVMQMDVHKHYAKPGAENFQKKLIEKYYKKVADLLSSEQRIYGSAV